MKKTLALIAAGCILTGMLFAETTKLTIKNTVGADSGELADWDLYTHSNETDIYGNTVTGDGISFGDRLQLDLENKYVTARLRLNAVYQNADSSLPSFILSPTGFVHVTPFKELGIIVGNSYNNYFAIPSAYLAADDSTTKFGRLLVNSSDCETYFGTNNLSLYMDGIAGGLTSSWKFGEDENIYVNAAAGLSFSTDFSTTNEMYVDAGINAGLENVFDFGFTTHELNADTRKFGLFAGLTGIPNAILNGMFYYNFTDSDFLPEARVERNDVDEFKKQTTKYAAGLSGGYYFNGIGIGLYADFITGLTNEYIGKIKYYDADDNLIKTEITTIIRGETIVKYKKGNAKRADGFTHQAVPLYAQLRAVWDISSSLQTEMKVKVRTMLRDSSQTWFTVYPKVSVKLPKKLGTLATGIKLDMNLTRYTGGLSGISIPLTYTYKFKTKI